jgi:zinc protease
MKKYSFYFLNSLVLLLFLSSGCMKSDSADFSIDYEKFTLENGLEVVFHVDRSDPVVAVTLTAHVGSAREVENRTGFAHLFEHLLFLESENLGKGGLDAMSARIGGSGANGSTSRDRTNYFQTVPNDALEKMIWAEADKLGWFINTVTEPVLAKEKQVVKNEKRQSVDNRPYGHTQFVIDKNLYPEDHPYNWQVIGSLEDLQAATVEDVASFFKRWYVPNNVTLVIAGDFDTEQAKTWVKKYFDEIPRGEDITPLEKRSGVVDENKKLYHEDNYARLPELTYVWPSVEQYHPDSYALNVLTTYLAEGKSAPFYKVLVEEKQLTSNVVAYNYASELAGQIQMRVRAYPDTDLDTVAAAIEEAFARFEESGIPETDLKRIKAGQETSFYIGLSSVLGKSFNLAQYNIFAGDPGFVEQDIQNILNVSADDVMRVYHSYIKDKNYIATSFVPKGQRELALEGSEEAEVVIEPIVQGAEEEFDPSIAAEYEKTPSSFDRSQEPPYGEEPEITIPDIWKAELDNGMQVLGIENDEVPMVNLNMSIEGGHLLDEMDKPGVAYMLAEMLNAGTANRSPEELEQAIQLLGASIDFSAGTESIQVDATTLARNYQETIDLITEMLLEPRWDEQEFELLKQRMISSLRQQQASPNAIASNAYRLLIFGDDDIRSTSTMGTEEAVSRISMEDLKEYYETKLSPNLSNLHVVGDISQYSVMQSLTQLEAKWEAKDVSIPDFDMPEAPDKSTVYFYDVPNASQSVLRFGYPALKFNDPDYYEATVMNYILGGGGFASRLTQELRETKGYTYGIRSGFSGGKRDGVFNISSGVRSNVTYESAQLVKDILDEYPETFSDADLETTKSFLLKSDARAFETAFSKLNILSTISEYDMPDDYVLQRQEVVRSMTKERIQELAREYLDTDKMIWLVVGDARTQKNRLRRLGFGEPVMINEEMNAGN